MNRLAYSLLFYLLMPLVLVRLLYRALRAPAYARRWPERFGVFTLPTGFGSARRPIWIHAVSVGETLAAVPLIRALQALHPDRDMVVTTMTPTGSERVRQTFGDTVFHVYLPYDLPGAAARFVRRIHPALLVVMETELWPNLLYHCERAGVPSLLVNARLSEKSARGYRRFGSLTRQMLGRLALIATQSQDDAQRFVELGAPAGRVRVTGSLKFDVEPPRIEASERPVFFQRVAALGRPVLIAASTRDGEERKVLTAFAACLERKPELLLVLVPRHPERFDAVARLCAELGLRTMRRSDERSFAATAQVLLGDSMGEMWHYYSLADVAFVGGSLVDTGCHNVLEPAALSLPVLVGPSQFNFQAICLQLQQAEGLITVSDADDLARQVLRIIDNATLRVAMGEAAGALVAANRGSLEKLVELIGKSLAAGEH